MKKLLCLMLALMFVLSVLISCGPNDDKPGETGESVETKGDYDPDLSALENALNNYGDLSALRGREFVILTPSPGNHFYHYSGAAENEVWYEEPSSSALPNAIYQRNRKAEDALGITITPMWGESPETINTTVNNNHAAGDRAFDVVLNRLDYEITYAANGYLYNYYELETMDTGHRWWDEQIVDTFTMYGNKLYVLSGDINYYDDYAVQIMLFNKDLCDTINREYPYQAVRDGKWTVDMMLEMAEAVKNDINADDVYTPGSDILGLGDNYDCITHFLYCYGQKMSTINSDGEPEIVWADNENVSVVERIYNIFTADYASTDTGGNASHFAANKLLFYGEMLGVLPTFKDMESDFGILPMPKGSESQDRYNAYVSNGWSTCYGIPITFSKNDANTTGIILECMSAASMDYVTPALYEQLLEARYIRDAESKEMLTYILDSKVYDLAGDLSWATALRSVYQNVLTKGPSSFATSMAAGKKAIDRSLNDFCSNIKKLETDAPSGNGKPSVGGDTTSEAPGETEPSAALYGIGDKIEAEDYDEKHGSVQAEMLSDGTVGMNLGYVNAGDWVKFDGIDLSGVVSVTLRGAGENGKIEFRLDDPEGDLLVETDVIRTGSWSVYNEFTFDFTATADGMHTVYIVFTGSYSNLDWFVFNGE